MKFVFQSSPSPKAGSYMLSQITLLRVAGFQSSPSPKAGSYEITFDAEGNVISFNPLPARRPGATAKGSWFYVGQICFNPLPARRPGATAEMRHRNVQILVSILSQPEGRELLEFLFRGNDLALFQSSPSPKAGSYCILRRL